MNEVKKCSISGIAFTMSTDAYSTLRQYLDSLKERYGKEADGEEIIADIEARIAELILSTHDNTRVVESPLINNIIAQLGSAEAISEESDIEGEKSTTGEPRIPRRLYRDMENAKLGGVCAGVGCYFGVDPVWIRLAIFAPLLLMPFSGISAVWFSLSAICGNLFGMFILTYLVLWFAIPAARSPRQKLEMTGEKITEQSIRKAAAASSSSDADTKARPVVASTVTAMGGCLLALFKIFAALVIFGLSMLVVALLVGIVAIVATGGSMVDLGVLSETLAISGTEMALCILGILTILVPASLLLYVLICLFISRKPSRKTSITLFIIWILIFLALCFTAIKTSHDIYTSNPFERIENTLENIEERVDNQVEAIENSIEGGNIGVESLNNTPEIGPKADKEKNTVTITTPNGTQISIFDTEKNGGTFRQTTINIDK